MFHIKICGITSPEDALGVTLAGADAIGLNFYGRSPRFVKMETARRIVEALDGSRDTPDATSNHPHPLPLSHAFLRKERERGVVKVGLFVDTPAGEVCEIFDDLGLDLVQLHGDQPPGFLTQLGGRPVMRAFRLGPEGLAPVRAYLDECRSLGCLPKLVLLDACTPGAYGGTGQVADWTAAAKYHDDPAFPPLVLAGGLTPANVAAAIRAVRPLAVDVASGVEWAPGRKDFQLVKALVEDVRLALS
jgi:phosphoribosylanthranilate isomerase